MERLDDLLMEWRSQIRQAWSMLHQAYNSRFPEPLDALCDWTADAHGDVAEILEAAIVAPLVDWEYVAQLSWLHCEYVDLLHILQNICQQIRYD